MEKRAFETLWQKLCELFLKEMETFVTLLAQSATCVETKYSTFPKEEVSLVCLCSKIEMLIGSWRKSLWVFDGGERESGTGRAEHGADLLNSQVDWDFIKGPRPRVSSGTMKSGGVRELRTRVQNLTNLGHRKRKGDLCPRKRVRLCEFATATGDAR